MKYRDGMRVAICIGVGLALMGCQGMTPFREGKQLLAEGRVEESLVKLQQASLQQPNNAEYRSAYLVTRERAIYVWLELADRLRGAERAAEAEALYRRVLALEPANSRALAALEDGARTLRHADLLKQAQAAWLKTDADTALAHLRTILTEDPKNKAAADLREKIAARPTRRVDDIKLTNALRKPITIEFRDTPIKQVFEVFARTSGLNFIFDRDVQSDLKTTIFLRDTTIQDALSMVLLTSQLEQRTLDANSILIYPNNAAKAREYQPLVVRTFFLNNADVKVAANTLRTIVKTRDLIVDERQNMIVMRDTIEAVRLAEKLLALQDLPEPEVMLEVEVLEVKRTRLIELGIQWPSQLTISPLSTTGGATVTVNDLRNISSASLGAAINPAIINLRKQDGDANLLANPRIRTRNREKARILVGDRVPNITTTATATGFVSESVTYVDVGLKLEVEPTVYMDDEIAIKIALEVSTIVNQIQTRSGSLAYQIGTRNASTVLRLKDGENQVLAGLINNEDRNTGNKIPVLGDIPILGRLFGSQRDDRQKTEIVLSITPRIIRNPQRPAISEAEFDAGTEASLRNRGLDAAPASAPAAKPPPPATPPPRGAGSAPPGTPAVPGAASPPVSPPAGATAIPYAGAASLSALSPPPGASPLAADLSSLASGGAGAGVAGSGAFTTAGTSAFDFQGPTRVALGAAFNVALTLAADRPITGVPFAIGFDPKTIEITAVTEGDFMRQGGVASAFSSRVDTVAGRVFATVTRADGAAGAGTIVILTARALSVTAATALQLIAATPIGPGSSAVSARLPPPLTIAITQ